MTDKKTFTSSTGVTIGLQTVSPGIIEKANMAFLKKFPEPVKPTYQVTTENEIVEIYEHNETTLETDEEKETYATWKKEHGVWAAKNTENLLKLFATQGMIILEDDSWISEQEFFDIEVPPPGPARRYHYFQTRVYGNPNDMMVFMSEMMRLQGAPEEQLEVAQNMFRTAVQGQTGNIQ